MSTMSGEGRLLRFGQAQTQEFRDMRSLPEACRHTQAAEPGGRSALERCRWALRGLGAGPACQPLRDEETQGGFV